jgi:cytoskeletal protein CcmA (bactofilin family)
MFGRDAKTSRIDNLIGKSVRIEGNIDFAGGLHLDGQVTGNVAAGGTPGSTLSVSKTGRIEGSVDVCTLVLDGTIKGDIVASDRLVLGPSAKIVGDVRYGVIESSLGAEIVGKLVPLSAKERAKPMPPPPRVEPPVPVESVLA